MKWHGLFIPLICRLFLGQGIAQERAHDAPFSCEPVVTGSSVFRGLALENYTPGQTAPVRFRVEEAFFGVPHGTKEREVPLKLEQAIGRGEELIVASSPDNEGETWSVEPYDEDLDKAYLQYLRALHAGTGPGRILGWTSFDDSPLSGILVRAAGAEREYVTRSGPSGTFELTGVAPGKYRVSASLAHYETIVPIYEVEVVRAGCAVVSLPFSFEGVIRGTVRDKRGRPQGGLRIDLMRIEGEGDSHYRSKESDQDGRYEFRGIEEGRYRIGISLAPLAPRQPYSKLYAPGVSDEAAGYTYQLSVEQPGAEADLWLPDPELRQFEIEVRWPDGRPAQGVTIALVEGRWPEPADLRLDDHGAITVWGYERLDYTIRASAKNESSNDETTSLEVAVPPGNERVRIQLVLSEKRSEVDLKAVGNANSRQ